MATKYLYINQKGITPVQCTITLSFGAYTAIGGSDSFPMGTVVSGNIIVEGLGDYRELPVNTTIYSVPSKYVVPTPAYKGQNCKVNITLTAPTEGNISFRATPSEFVINQNQTVKISRT